MTLLAESALFLKIALQIVTHKNKAAIRNSETQMTFSGTTIIVVPEKAISTFAHFQTSGTLPITPKQKH